MVRPILRYVIAVGGIVLLVGSALAIAPQIWPPDPDASLTLKNGQIVGETIGFVRWLRFEIDGGIGMMIRLP